MRQLKSFRRTQKTPDLTVGRITSLRSIKKNMADSKELVASESTWSPEFIQELLPAAERTALLYHLSFLCLGSFPKLERMIRHQATETQMLFGSSEAVLLKCVGTSSNLVTSLFPILMKAIEKNKPKLAVIYLEKARTWIKDIIRAVDDMVKRYDQQTQSVKTITSDVYEEQKENEEKRTQHTEEMKALEDALVNLEVELGKNFKDMEEIKKKSNRPYNDAAIVAKQAELAPLLHEKNSLREQEWTIKFKRIDLQLTLANSKIQLGVIPNPVHLKEVQLCLNQIRQILVDLKNFWEKVDAMLELMKEKTFVGEELVDLDHMKEEFLQSIEETKKCWQTFGTCCQRAQNIFSFQSKDAYKFLEINPSSLSEDERIEQYKSIMEKLRKINPQGSIRAAITETE